MSLDKLIAESGAKAAMGNEAITDIKNLTRTLLKYAERLGAGDKIDEEYAFKIAAGIFGNWEWQIKNIREGKQRGALKKSNLWTPNGMV